MNTPKIVERIADSVVDIHRKRRQDQYILNLLREDREKKQKALKNLLSAIEEGIITPTTKQRMTELEDEINILNSKILEEENKDANLITREQIIEFLTILPEQEPQLIIDTMIRKVILYDDKIDIHFNFCNSPQSDEPDNFPTEDCRAYTTSFQSSLKSTSPPLTPVACIWRGVFVLSRSSGNEITMF